MEDYSNLYSNSLKRKYNQITNDIILENIKSIEDKISQMKIDLENLDKNENESYNENNYQNFSLQEENSPKNIQKISEIFDLSKFSLKKIQENINNLTEEEKSNIKIQVEHSYFYLNINVDKSFEIFLEKLSNKKIEKNLNSLIKEYCKRFISRILELDRITYVRNILIIFFIKFLIKFFNKFSY